MLAMKEFEKNTGIRFNTNMSGKMAGVNCLSTSNLVNPFCTARKKNPACICSKCFADTTCKRYAALNRNMIKNTEILTSVLFDVSEMPIVTGPIFRLESFGDLSNTTQCINYFRLCKANPGVRFALWTKNPAIMQRALQQEEKPGNLVILLSSPKTGVKADAGRWPFVDKTFTVYRKNDMPPEMINCGARSCITCQRCYSRDTENDIREYLK